MSGVNTNSDGRAEGLNAAAAHDTGLYDPNQHDNQIVAVYESRALADAARDALIGAGVPERAIQVIDHASGGADPASGDADPASDTAEDRGRGFWGAIKSLFAPDEDVTAYSQAVGRGHPMVVVTPDAKMDRHRVIQVLEESSPIDFDAKLEEWRQAGYDNLPQTGAASSGTPSVNMSDTGYRTGLVEERMRVGRREPATGAGRVRSYVAERPAAEHEVRLREERMGEERGSAGQTDPGSTGPNATPGVVSSGMNSPRV
ncbi:MAG: hypothetical protein NVSMB18_17190 [Acetobacteraceae bacterium]